MVRAPPNRLGSSTETLAIAGEEDDESVEGVFAQDTEAASDEYTLDGGWRVAEVEPVKTYRDGNGRRAGELDEGQQSLFS